VEFRKEFANKMNRADRRKLKKRMKGNSIFLEKGVEQVDHKNDQWCHRHQLKLDDPDHPTDRDKRLIASVEYRTLKLSQEDGKMLVVKQCPRCFSTVEVGVIERALLA
jgi:hypothetical protein